jgi:hypothetical protein
MGTNGYATITLVDNGGAAIVVPNQNVQFVVGTSSQGTIGQIVATKSITTLNNTFGWGPLVEAAALATQSGGTVLACRATSATAGVNTAVTHTGTGLSVMTVTGALFDTYFVEALVMQNATIGTVSPAPLIQISLDAGRSFSPSINLGVALTYLIPGTGMTLNFTTATIVAGDTYTFSTTEPLWNTAGITVAFAALAASPYAQQGFGSVHIPGVSSISAAGTNATDMTTVGGLLEAWALQTAPLYSQAIMSFRDANVPTAWGGSGETDVTWSGLVATAAGGVAQKTISGCAAYYNMPSALVNPMGVVPQFRRSISYAVAARTVTSGFTANRSWGRVKFGPMPYILVNPLTMGTDGFVYHDESVNPGLNAARCVSMTSRGYLQGRYVLQANNLATTGAQINSWPLMSVASVARTILIQVGQQSVNDDVRLLKTGLMDPRDVATIQKGLQSAIDSNMTAQQLISSAQVVVDGTQNLISNGGQVPVTCTLVQRQTILQVNITLQYVNPAQS